MLHNHKMMCVCELNDCKLYLEQPITLPCGSTICKEHIDQHNDDQRFTCSLCNEEHLIPANGFKINKQIAQIIDNGYHLNEFQKTANDNLKKLESIVGKYDNINADEIIYDYFSQLRNKVDLKREKSMEEINNRSEEIIRDLYKLEKQIKSNASKLEKLNLEELKNQKIPQWRDHLRKPDDSIHFQDMINDLNKYIDRIQFEINDYNTKLFLNKNVLFITQDDKLLGKIIEIDRKFGVDTKNTELLKALNLVNTSKSFINQVVHKLWNNLNNEHEVVRHNFLGKVVNYISNFPKFYEKAIKDEVKVHTLSDHNMLSIETSKQKLSINNDLEKQTISNNLNQQSLSNYYQTIEKASLIKLHNRIPRFSIQTNTQNEIISNIRFLNKIYNEEFSEFLSSGLNAQSYYKKRLNENMQFSLRSKFQIESQNNRNKQLKSRFQDLLKIMKIGGVIMKKCVEIKNFDDSISNDPVTTYNTINNNNKLMIKDR